MIAGSGRRAGEVIAVVPPRWAEATVENIAINAVMAGCLPQHMPLVIAALQAAADPEFGLYSVQATTHPVRGADAGLGAHRPGAGPQSAPRRLRARAFAPTPPTGRALRLVLMNVGGGIPGAGRPGHPRLAGQVQLLRRGERGGHALGAVPGDARIRPRPTARSPFSPARVRTTSTTTSAPRPRPPSPSSPTP